jgi:hypothetical protein
MLVSFPLSDVRKELRQTVLMAIVGDGYGGRQFHGANWVSITSAKGTTFHSVRVANEGTKEAYPKVKKRSARLMQGTYHESQSLVFT